MVFISFDLMLIRHRALNPSISVLERKSILLRLSPIKLFLTSNELNLAPLTDPGRGVERSRKMKENMSWRVKTSTFWWWLIQNPQNKYFDYKALCLFHSELFVVTLVLIRYGRIECRRCSDAPVWVKNTGIVLHVLFLDSSAKHLPRLCSLYLAWILSHQQMLKSRKCFYFLSQHKFPFNRNPPKKQTDDGFW